MWTTVMSPSENPIQEPRKERLLLTGAFPALSVELRQLLEQQGEYELAAQVSGLT
jgi:hypothetical protein